MKRILSVCSIIGLLLLMPLTSCSDSDDDEAASKKMEFVGRWISKYEIFENGNIPISSEPHKIEFTKDGRYAYSCKSRLPVGRREIGWFTYDEQKHKLECETNENRKRVIYIDYITEDEAKFRLQDIYSSYNRGKWYCIVCERTTEGVLN